MLAEFWVQHSLFLVCGSSPWNFFQFLNVKEFIFKIKTDKQLYKNVYFPPKKDYWKISEKLIDFWSIIYYNPVLLTDLNNPKVLLFIIEKAELGTRHWL